MGISKTEINLRRLLSSSPNQHNLAKLVHYVATARELLEQLSRENSPEGLPSVSKAKLAEYAESIEALASTLISSQPDIDDPNSSQGGNEIVEISGVQEQSRVNKSPSHGLRRRLVPNVGDLKASDDAETSSSPVKLDTSAQDHIEKHRKLQEDLTDEMVVLARQLKESSFLMNQSIKETEKILDSTERAVEHSLATTGHANARAVDVYSRSFKTTCFTWLLIFMMSCVFVLLVLLIRVT